MHRVRHIICFALAAFLSAGAGADVTKTFSWDATPSSQTISGITYDLESNGAHLYGITGTSAELTIPINPGQLIDARVRAVPPADQQIACCPPPGCGDPPAAPTVACWTVSAWATLVAILPSDQTDLSATKTLQEAPQVPLTKIGTGASVDGIPGASDVLTKDSGSAAGDLAVIFISRYRDGGGVPITPAGFVLQQSFRLSDDGGTNGSYMDVYTRVLDGTEGASYTVTWSFSAYHSTMLLTLRGSAALSYSSISVGSVAFGTTCTAPSVDGLSTQGLVVGCVIGDPATTSTPSGMTLGLTGPQQTNTGTLFFQTLSADGATGTRVSTLGTSRVNVGWSMLVNGASAGGGQVSLNASPAVVTDAGGALVAQIATSGAALNVATSSGVLSIGIPLTGVSSSIASSTGQVGLSTGVAATSSASADAAGQINMQIGISGQAIANALINAAMSSSVALGGAASVQADSAGDLQTTSASQLSGGAVGQALSTGNLTELVAIVGAAQSVALAGAGLSKQVPVTAQAVASALADGGMSVVRNLSAAAIAGALSTGNMTQLAGLVGAANASALAGGQFGLAINMSAQSIANALAAADLGISGQTALAGVASGSSLTTGALRSSLGIGGAGQASSDATGVVALSMPMAASSIVSAVASGGLGIVIGVNAQTLANAIAAGTLDTTGTGLLLAGGAQGVTDAMGALIASLSFGSFAANDARAGGQIGIPVGLGGTGRAETTAHASLGVGAPLVANARYTARDFRRDYAAREAA